MAARIDLETVTQGEFAGGVLPPLIAHIERRRTVVLTANFSWRDKILAVADAHKLARRPDLRAVVIEDANRLTTRPDQDLNITQRVREPEAHFFRALIHMVVPHRQQIDAVAQQNIFLEQHQRGIHRAAAILIGPDRVVLHHHNKVDFAPCATQSRLSQIDLDIQQLFRERAIINERTRRRDQEMHAVVVKGIERGTGTIGIDTGCQRLRRMGEAVFEGVAIEVFLLVVTRRGHGNALRHQRLHLIKPGIPNRLLAIGIA